jgi:DNA-directed RNA polymerase specialized sigma24 family protein
MIGLTKESRMPFKGNIVLYGKEYFINKETGEGTDKVISVMDPFISGLAKKTSIPGFSFEDIKQELILFLINGIKSYDTESNASLSSFLHIHVNNKRKSMIIEHNINKKNATLLNVNRKSPTNSKYNIVYREKSLSEMAEKYDDGESKSKSDNLSSFVAGKVENNFNILNVNNTNEYKQIDFRMSLDRITENMEPKMRSVLYMIAYEGYSVVDAAKTVGLPNQVVTKKLYRLSNNSRFIELLRK